MLFFGCRKKSEDYIYEDELTSYEKDGTIADLHVAFSVSYTHLTLPTKRIV